MSREPSDLLKRKMKNLFDKRFAELVVYVKEHGRFPVPSQNAILSSWISGLKSRNRKGIIDKVFYRKLNSLGIEWGENVNHWMERTNELKCFLMKEKRLPDINTNFKMKVWMNTQIKKLHKGKLTDDKKIAIEEIEFLVNEMQVKKLTNADIIKVEKEKIFQREIQSLINFRAEHPDKWPDYIKGDASEKNIAKWCRLQKRRYMHNELEEQMIKQLEVIGFSFDIYSGFWYTRFNELKAHISQYKTLPTRSNGLHLLSWSKNQFRTFDFLSEDKQKLLDSIQFKTFFPA